MKKMSKPLAILGRVFWTRGAALVCVLQTDPNSLS